MQTDDEDTGSGDSDAGSGNDDMDTANFSSSIDIQLPPGDSLVVVL